MGILYIRHPVSESLVDSIFQCPAACFDSNYFRSQQPHPEDVEFLAPHVFSAHVDDATQSKQGADGCSGNPMLPGSGLGDYSRLAHSSPRRNSGSLRAALYAVKSCSKGCISVSGTYWPPYGPKCPRASGNLVR